MAASNREGHTYPEWIGRGLILGGVLLLASPTGLVLAQETLGPPQPRRGPVTLDRVIATVGSKAILLSTVLQELGAEVAARRAGGRMVTEDEQDRMFSRLLEAFQREAVQAQAAKTKGKYSPEEIERFVTQGIRHERERRIRESGSLNKYKEDLKGLKRSTFAMDQHDREEILKQLALQDLRAQLRDQRPLLITPRELHAHYLKVLPSRRVSPSSEVAILRFANGDGGEAARRTTLEKAGKAAEAWRRQGGEGGKEGEGSAELGERFGGEAVPNQKGIRNVAEDPNQPWIKDFVGRAKEGEVSEPLVQGRATWVLKLLRHSPGRAYPYEDPRVQEQLRQELLDQKFEILFERQFLRDKTKVPFWQDPRVRFR